MLTWGLLKYKNAHIYIKVNAKYDEIFFSWFNSIDKEIFKSQRSNNKTWAKGEDGYKGTMNLINNTIYDI